MQTKKKKIQKIITVSESHALERGEQIYIT